MAHCDVKKQHEVLTERARNEAIGLMNSAIEDLIDAPSVALTRKLENQLKSGVILKNRKEITRELKREKERYSEHKLLYDFLRNSSKELFLESEVLTPPMEFINKRAEWIQGQFQRAFNRSVFKNKSDVYNSGLNSSEYWDAGSIRAVRRRIEQAHKDAVTYKGKKLTGFQNTVMKSQNLVGQLDPTGMSGSLVKDLQQLLDTYLMDGFLWKEPMPGIIGKKGQSKLNLTDINAEISAAAHTSSIIGQSDVSGFKLTQVANHFVNDLESGQVKNVIARNVPTDPKLFGAWRNSFLGDQFFKMQKLESERHPMGPSGVEYVLIPLHKSPEGKKYLKQLRTQDMKDGKFSEENKPGKFERAHVAYRIPTEWNSFLVSIRSKKIITKDSLKEHLLPNELEDGFHRALEDKVYPYELIEGTQTPKKKFAKFVRDIDFRGEFTYQPPKGWMEGIWKALDMQAEWYESFADTVLDGENSEVNQEYSDVKNSTINALAETGMDDEEISELLSIVEQFGMKDNFWKARDGEWVNANSKFRKIAKGEYSHTRYWPEKIEDQMVEALDKIEKEIEEVESLITGYEKTREHSESTRGDKLEAKEEIEKGQKRLKELKEGFNEINKKLFSDPSTDEGRDEITQANRILATKHRTLYTDKTQRRKDRKVLDELVDEVFRAIALTRIKTKAYRAILNLRSNPALVRYLVNEMRTAAGEPNIEAGFFGFDYSDERMSDLLSTIPGVKMSADDMKHAFLFMRSIKTGFNLGWNTGITNQFQRINLIVNYGLDKWMEAVRALEYGDEHFSKEEIWAQIRETGTLEPANAMIDMLTMGMDNADAGYRDFLVPLVDMFQLWKQTTLNGWLSSSSGWNEILAKATVRSEEEQIKVERLIEIKTKLWDFFHKDTKNKEYLKRKLKELRVGLRQGYVNRLVKARISWFPTGLPGKAIFTLKGGEEQMRAEGTYIGMRMMLGMGRITVGKRGTWKYTDSKEAVDMARLSVYSTMFGMNAPHLAKMMRGGFGSTWWQWKPFDWFQTQEEYRAMNNALLSSKYESPLVRGVTLPTRILTQIMKKGIRSGIGVGAGAGGYFGGIGGALVGTGIGAAVGNTKRYQDFVKFLSNIKDLDKKSDDKALNTAADIAIWKGGASVISLFMFYTSEIYGGLKILQTIGKYSGFRNPVSQRAIFGMESPLLSRSFHAIMLTLMLLEKMGVGDIDVEDDEVWEDVIRDYAPPIFLTIFLLMIDFEKNFARATKTWLPSMGPKELIGVKEVQDLILD